MITRNPKSLTKPPPEPGSGAAATGLCRDCIRLFEADTRCPACGSTRIIRHAELTTLHVAHVDCDAFFAAIEKRDRPELRNKPVIIGGDGPRGVVATACYIARIHGVKSAMPMFKARERCPDAVIIRPDAGKYRAVGMAIREMMMAVSPLVEPLSIDEAFIDLAGTERLHGLVPAQVMARLANDIEQQHGITVSIGLSCNKFLAKLASERDKPRGFSVIGTAEAADYLADLPVSAIWGVGPKLTARLEAEGVRTIADLRRADPDQLRRRHGSMGARLLDLAWGRDSRAVQTERATKSLSSETTFEHDISDPATLAGHLWQLCEKLAARLREKNFEGRTVTLKLKTAGFRQLTRSQTLPAAIRSAESLYQSAHPLLYRAADGTPFRLIGIGLDIDDEQDEPNQQANLFREDGGLDDPGQRDTETRRRQIEDMLSGLRQRHGPAAAIKGRSISRDRDD